MKEKEVSSIVVIAIVIIIAAVGFSGYFLLKGEEGEGGEEGSLIPYDSIYIDGNASFTPLHPRLSPGLYADVSVNATRFTTTTPTARC